MTGGTDQNPGMYPDVSALDLDRAFAALVSGSRAVLLGVCLAVAPCSAEQIEYTFGAGDRIRITVFGHEDLSGEFTLSETGSVSLPLAGSLDLDGLTIRQAEEEVVDALKPDYLLNPRVGIEVLNYRPFYILGEVKEPGSYPYVNGMTVTEAVALGGGFTYRAKKEQVIIIRASDPARTERPVPATGVVLPGDVVKVMERFF